MAKLPAKGRGSLKSPGEFRKSQNWIGGTRPGNAAFVPPPPEEAIKCLNELELFLHNEEIPVLIKAALVHVQFETIHPFLDGNGRVGRLLITLLLCEGKLLKQPLLYLSYYFKLHRQYYYELLNSIRDQGDWERRLDFFAEAVTATATATQSLEIIMALDKQVREARKKIQSIGKGSKSAMLRHPIAGTQKLKEETGLTDATVNASLRKLQELSITEETTGQKRNRLFCYHTYMALLNQ